MKNGLNSGGYLWYYSHDHDLRLITTIDYDKILKIARDYKEES